MPSALPKTETSAAQVNPSAFITDTTARFYLLLVMVFAISIYLLNGLYSSWDQGEQRLRQCLKESSIGIDMDSFVLPKVQPQMEPFMPAVLLSIMYRFLTPCHKPIVQDRAPWIAFGLLGLFMLAGIIYRLYPRWVLRDYQPAGAEMNTITQAVHAMAEAVGLNERPQLWLAPLDAHPGALTLVSSGQHPLVLSNGLVALYARDRRVFDAIIRHELAHIHYKDTRKIYAARALWWAFVITIVLPDLITGVLNGPWDISLIESLTRILLLTALVYLTQMSIFRAREYYADAQAVHWAQGNRGPTQQALRLLSDAATPHRPKLTWRIDRWMVWRLHGLRTAVRSALSYHPSRRQREQAIREPTTLLNASGVTAFVTALVAAILMASLGTLLSNAIAFFAVDSLEHFVELVESLSESAAHSPLGGAILGGFPFFVAAVVSSLFMMSSLGFNVWRAVFAERVRPHSRHFPALLGLITACGFVLGNILGGSAPILTHLDPETLQPIASIPKTLTNLAIIHSPGLVILAIGFSLLLYALRSIARAWVGVSLIAWSGRVMPYIALLLSTVALSLGLLYFTWIFQTLLLMIQFSELLPMLLSGTPELVPDIQKALAEEGRAQLSMYIKIGVASLWFLPSLLWLTLLLIALPLLAAYWQRRDVNPHYAARVFYEQPEPSELQRMIQISLRPWTVLFIGIGSGVVFSLLIPLLEGIEAPPAVAHLLFMQTSPGIQRFLGIVLCAVLAQGLLALVVALMIKELKVVHGLATSYSAGAVMAVGIFSYFYWRSGKLGDITYYMQMLSLVIHSGLVLSLVLSLIGTRVQRFGRRRRGTPLY